MLVKGWAPGMVQEFIGVVDIGTSKIACLIAAIGPGPRAPGPSRPAVRVIGVGHQRSRGVKAGVIADLDQAEQAVRAAIAQAERMAGVTLDHVRVSVSCGRLRSLNFAASTDVETGIVTEQDIARVLAGGEAFAERDGRALVHMNQIALRLDGAPGIGDPRGMAAGKFSMDLHAVTADEAPLRNLRLVIERCYLSPTCILIAPYASGLAVTSDEERRLGVTAIDMGGGATTLAMFAEGELIHADAMPLGGNHVTLDIARTLHTPLAEAERIKALYGTLVSAQSDQHDLFSYPLTGEEDGSVGHATKARLGEIIRVRIEALFGQVRKRIEACGVAVFAGGRVVLTGGGSQLVGLADFAANELGRPVRVAGPHAVSGLPPVASSPPFATVVGLLSAPMPQVGASRFRGRDRSPQGYLGRVGAWLRQGF